MKSAVARPSSPRNLQTEFYMIVVCDPEGIESGISRAVYIKIPYFTTCQITEVSNFGDIAIPVALYL